MATFSPDQRNYYYLIEAERVGIHKPILTALYAAHSSPSLADAETGLGISPANRVSLAQVNTFPQQVQSAANVIRSLSESLLDQGWKGGDLWEAEQGRYTEQFLQKVASGYAPIGSESAIARLEACDWTQLKQAYLTDLAADGKAANLPDNLAYLDRALISLVDGIPDYYVGLPHQRDAILSGVRIWRGLDTREAAIASLVPNAEVTTAMEDESQLDIPLKQFVQGISANYGGYPQQREALIRVVQLWRQMRTREEAIASLKTNSSPEENLTVIDPALIAFVQHLPNSYQGQGSQRHALTEAFRIWRQLDSRATALATLGIQAEQLNASTTDRTEMLNLATQMDRELLRFVRRLPGDYQELDHQREALIRLVQLWRSLPTRNQTIDSLLEDQKRLETVRPSAPEAPPPPIPVVILKRPTHWTPDNLQLFAPIIPDGHFTWADATHGGTQMPPNQATVEAIIRMATLAQRARDRIGRPLIVVNWYRPFDRHGAMGSEASHRYQVGDAIDFICEGLTGNQLYWFLEPWWPGGLGRYTQFPYLCHIDARSYRVRWRN
ncbi:peptidase M15 [Allocoleopsis franciscana]|uniref:Peptidase M15 n=1 Tax=Allocoleopsis franciscana PCC 7113 TaxID=1173027 RepID=K9W9Q5_9CYAN|nr:peptidase M15 [Allocoleopsis franciscana]AFZ16983.1 Peptidase M15 [Allocoleopsis franciscana PCC 7113]